MDSLDILIFAIGYFVSLHLLLEVRLLEFATVDFILMLILPAIVIGLALWAAAPGGI